MTNDNDTTFQELAEAMLDLKQELDEIQIWKRAHSEFRALQAEFALCYDPDKETLMQALKRIVSERDAARHENGKYHMALAAARQEIDRLRAENARLGEGLREVRRVTEPHEDEWGKDIGQDPECFCARCIAVRALSPGQKEKP